MDRAGHISDLITMYTEMGKQPGVNKKAINKTVARLEEARLWAKEIQPGKINGVPDNGSAGKIVGMNESDQLCTCPPGAIDKVNCPVHQL